MAQLASLKSPEINKHSRALADRATGGKKIVERMALDQQAKQAKQLELKKAMDERALANHMAECVFLAWGIGSALKLLIRRKRQNPIHRRVRMLTKFSSWSFPSQHAAVVVAFAFAMWPNPGALALAIVVCCSRVLSGAHYAGDVLAGVVVGLVAGRLA